MINYGRHEVTQADIDAVAKVLRSDFLTQGPTVPAFESAVASRVRATYGVAVNSATSAMHLACIALGLTRGDRLWTVPNTFVASANCGLYCGAEVDFVDIDPLTWNMSSSRLRDKLMSTKKEGKLPKVVVPVHFAGQATDQEAIWELAQEFGFRVLEDASHGIGATRNKEPVGSCRWSDITVFSFHPVKIVTTGEGGMALTNDAALAERMRLLRSHGITRDPSRFQMRNTHDADASQPPWYYEQQALGFNFRMSDIQAALGLSQMDRLSTYLSRRNALARRYDAALQGLPLQLPTVKLENSSAFHLYVVRLSAGLAPSRRKIVERLKEDGIGVNVHYIPVHLQPYYRERGFAEGQFPEAETHGRDAMSLPLFPALTLEEQDHVIAAVSRAM